MLNIIFNSSFSIIAKELRAKILEGTIGIGGINICIAALLNPIMDDLGFGISMFIFIKNLFMKYFCKSQRYKNIIEESKMTFNKKFEELQDSFSSNYTIFKESIIMDLKIKIEIASKKLIQIIKKKEKN